MIYLVRKVKEDRFNSVSSIFSCVLREFTANDLLFFVQNNLRQCLQHWRQHIAFCMQNKRDEKTVRDFASRKIPATFQTKKRSFSSSSSPVFQFSFEKITMKNKMMRNDDEKRDKQSHLQT